VTAAYYDAIPQITPIGVRKTTTTIDQNCQFLAQIQTGCFMHVN